MHRLAGLTAALLMLAPAGTSQENDTAVEKELAKLKGRWKQYSFEAKGVVALVPDRSEFPTYSIDGNKWVIDGPKGRSESTFRIDPSKTPKEFDRTFKAPDGKDATAPCIYKLDGDTLTICTSRTADINGKLDDGKGRPTEFKTTDGEMIFADKRVKE